MLPVPEQGLDVSGRCVVPLAFSADCFLGSLEPDVDARRILQVVLNVMTKARSGVEEVLLGADTPKFALCDLDRPALAVDFWIGGGATKGLELYTPWLSQQELAVRAGTDSPFA